MPKTVKRRKNKLAGRYRNRWPDEAEISGRMIPKWVADSCRNRWPDHPEICIHAAEAGSPLALIFRITGTMRKDDLVAPFSVGIDVCGRSELRLQRVV